MISYWVGSSESLAHFVPAQKPPQRKTNKSDHLGVSFGSAIDQSSATLHDATQHITWEKSSSEGLTRSAKSSSFMKIMKKAKLGSFRSKSAERINTPSPPPPTSRSPQHYTTPSPTRSPNHQNTPSPTRSYHHHSSPSPPRSPKYHSSPLSPRERERGDLGAPRSPLSPSDPPPPSRSASPASSPSASSNNLNEGQALHDERSLIRIWADQVDGGVEGYKGFLIRPDTTTRELLTTVHTKMRLSGHPTDYFLCATFDCDDVPDRPLMNAERPLYLHNQWSQSYRFEVRHKPTVIIMVYGGARLASSSVPFMRGAVEVTEDAPTWRFIAELCRRYDLDTNERYNIVERLGGSERILHTDERPALCQKRWKPHQDGQFVLIPSLTPTSIDDNTSFTDITPMMKIDRSVSTDSSSSVTFPTDLSTSFYVPDFESADHASLERSASSQLLASDSIVSYCSSNTKHILNIGIPQENINIGFQEMHDRWYNSPLSGNERKRTSSSENRSIERYLFSVDKDEEQEEEEEEKDSIQNKKFDIMCGLRPLSQETSGSFEMNIISRRKSHSSDEITDGEVTIDHPIPPINIEDTAEPIEQAQCDSPRSVSGNAALVTPRNLSSVSLQMSWDNFDSDIGKSDTRQQRAHVALQEEIKKRVEGEIEGQGEQTTEEIREDVHVKDEEILEDESTNEMGSISTVLLEQSRSCYKALENKADKAQEKLMGELSNTNVLIMSDHDDQDDFQNFSLSSSTRTLYDMSLEEDDYISSVKAGNSLVLNDECIIAVDADYPIVRKADSINPVSVDNIKLDLEYGDQLSSESSSTSPSINSGSVTSLNENIIHDEYKADYDNVNDSLLHTLNSSLTSCRPHVKVTRPQDLSGKELCASHEESGVSNLKEALERMRNEIDEVLEDYSESYPTSLDSSRHEFSDSPYGDTIENPLGFTSTGGNSSSITRDKSQTEKSPIFDTVGSYAICESSDIGVLIEDPYIEDDITDISEIGDIHDSLSYTSLPSNYTMSVSLTYLSDNESINRDSQFNIEVDQSDDDSTKYTSLITEQPAIDQLSLDDTNQNILFQDETGLRSRSIDFLQLRNIFEMKEDSPTFSSSQPSLGPELELSITSFGPDDESEEDGIIYPDEVNIVQSFDIDHVNTAGDVNDIIDVNVVKDDINLRQGVIDSVIDAGNVAKHVVEPDDIVADVVVDVADIDDFADAFDVIDKFNAVANNVINVNPADDAVKSVHDIVDVVDFDNDDKPIERISDYTDVADNMDAVSANIINVTASAPRVESVVVIVSDDKVGFPKHDKRVVEPDVIVADIIVNVAEIDDFADTVNVIDKFNDVAINVINAIPTNDAVKSVHDIVDVVDIDNDDRHIERITDYTNVADNMNVVSANIINVTASAPHVESASVIVYVDTVVFPDVDVFAKTLAVTDTLDDGVGDLVNSNAANNAAEPVDDTLPAVNGTGDRHREIDDVSQSSNSLSVDVIGVAVTKDVYGPIIESVDDIFSEGDDFPEAYDVADTLDLIATHVINTYAVNDVLEAVDDIIDIVGIDNGNNKVIEIDDVSDDVPLSVMNSNVFKSDSGSLAESTDGANVADITVDVDDIDGIFEASDVNIIEGIAVDVLYINSGNDNVETVNNILDVVDVDSHDDNIIPEIEGVYESIDIAGNVFANVPNVTVSKDVSGPVDDVVDDEVEIGAAVIERILDVSHISSYVPADEINVDTSSGKNVGDVHDVDDNNPANYTVQSANVDEDVDDIVNITDDNYISNGINKPVNVAPVLNEDNTDCIETDCSQDSSPKGSTLYEKLKKLKARFHNSKFRDVEGCYEIKLPCIWEITDEEDTTSPPLSRLMAHADLKRQYKNLLAEIEETKPKLRQLEVLQGELSSMQKAYHELKEQALRMSAEQEMQKSQIEEEIKKLKISNQDLVQKTKDSKAEAVVSTIMELEKLYSDRITALEKALRQKDAMVGDLEQQNRNMMTQLNLNRRQSVQLETANELLHKRNEVLHVERSEGEINPAQFFDSDNQRLALLAKQCDALQQTVSSLESTLVLRVKELNETYKDLDEMRSDLRSAEVARIEAEAQLDVHKREVSRLSSVNEDFATEIKQRIADNGKLEQDNRHLNENLESIQLQYNDTKDRVSRLENALLSQEKALNAYKDAEKGARTDVTSLEKRLEVSSQEHRAREDEIKKLRKEVEKAKKGTSMYNLCNAVKPGETLELISVDLPAVTEHIPRGLYLKQGANGIYLDKIDLNTSAGRLHRLACGDKVVEINLQDVSNATFEAIKKDFDSPRAMQLVVMRIAPDVREESKLRAEALKDQMTALVVDLDKTAKLCQGLQGDGAGLKNELANVKAKQKSELESAGNQKNLEELHALKALLTQKDQYLKTLETTVKSKNELLVTLEMDSHRSPRPTPNTSANRSSSLERSRSNGTKQEHSNSISELVNRYG